MNKRLFIIFICLLLVPIVVVANQINDRTGPLSNYTLLFYNTNFDTFYINNTNTSGEFLLPKDGLTFGEDSNLFKLVICKNPKITISQTYISSLKYYTLECNGTGVYFLYFDGIIKNGNLEISINMENLSEIVTEDGLTGHCVGHKNLYCSITVTKDKNFNESVNYYSNFSNYSEAFSWNSTEIGEGHRAFALFQTDGNKSTLNILNMVVKKINITNPYHQDVIADLNLKNSGCILPNGKINETKSLKPDETLPKTIIQDPNSKIQCDKNKIEINFIKIENPNFNISIIDITLVSLFGVSLTFGIYIYKKRKNKLN